MCDIPANFGYSILMCSINFVMFVRASKYSKHCFKTVRNAYKGERFGNSKLPKFICT